MVYYIHFHQHCTSTIISSSSAVPGIDYEVIIQQELMFRPGNIAICTNIQIFDDEALESMESFNVSLTKTAEDRSVVSLLLQTAIVQILEDPTDGEESRR